MRCLLLSVSLAVMHASTGTSLWAITSEAPKEDGKSALVRLMPQQKDQRLRDKLPKVADSEVQAILDDPRLILYTDREMPTAYQFWDGRMPGVHRTNYNISANALRPARTGPRT
jgi:hypothetical protein